MDNNSNTIMGSPDWSLKYIRSGGGFGNGEYECFMMHVIGIRSPTKNDIHNNIDQGATVSETMYCFYNNIIVELKLERAHG